MDKTLICLPVTSEGAKCGTLSKLATV